MARILVVDDQESFLSLLLKLLESRGYEAVGLTTGQEAIDRLERESFDLIICDLFMQPVSGMKVLRWISERMPQVPVVMLTGHGTVETAHEALTLGAFDYITKPFEMADVIWTVERALMTPDRPPEIQYVDGKLVANSPGIKATIKALQRLAPTALPILITGEAGVGKRELAAQLPRWSGNPDIPCVHLPCSELDGGEDTPGATEAPDVGGLVDIGPCTLCLADVEMLPPTYQRELLGLLRRQQVSASRARAGIPLSAAEPSAPLAPPGASGPRIVALTTANMDRYVQQGLFDAELYTLLRRFAVPVPPLRERREDILPLAYHFMRLHLGERPLPTLESDVHGILEHHNWTGNAGELRAMITTMLAADVPAFMTRRELPPLLRGAHGGGAAATPMRVLEGNARGHWLRLFLKAHDDTQ